MNNILEAIDLIEAAKWLALLLLGFGLAYYRASSRLRGTVGSLIAEAEQAYGEGGGGAKFRWVCEALYGALPAPLRAVITRSMIERLVQNTFDAMAAYAKMQLDRLLDSTMPDIERTEDEPCLK